ncbi:MAG: aminotransferase class IV [Oscillospiraceae bacterium]|nr:aminotransferase class IV [Oscillospiraceae bacterium]
METLAYYNGKIGTLDEISIPVKDRSVYFGDGIYDATMSRNGKIVFLDEHIDRFFNSARLLEIELPYTKEELRVLLLDLVKKVDAEEMFVYWQASRGTAQRSHEYPKGVKANLLITIWPKKATRPNCDQKLMTAEDIRFQLCNIKTLNLIPSVMASQRAAEHGCDETVFHRGNIVTECAHSNVSILKDGVFITHPADNHILPGIARAHLIKNCKELGIPVEERLFTVEELYNADEIITSSSGKPACAAKELNGQPCGGKDGATLKRLFDAVIAEFAASVS